MKEELEKKMIAHQKVFTLSLYKILKIKKKNKS